MCGIAGFNKLTPFTLEMTPYLCIGISSRGADSWGISNGEQEVKELGPILKTWTYPDWLNIKESGDKPIIIHTRNSSVGIVSKENQHPFTIVTPEGRKVVGIHNGAISNYLTLREDWKTFYAVDSAYIFHAIAHNLPLKDIQGWGNIAWFDTQHPGLNLCRFNNDDLHLFKDPDGTYIFGSTEFSVQLACTFSLNWVEEIKLKPNIHYNISPEGELTEVGEMGFGPRYTYVSQTNNYTHRREGTPTQGDYGPAPIPGRVINLYNPTHEEDVDGGGPSEVSPFQSTMGSHGNNKSDSDTDSNISKKVIGSKTSYTEPLSHAETIVGHRRNSISFIGQYTKIRGICATCGNLTDRRKNIVCTDCFQESLKLLNKYKNEGHLRADLYYGVNFFSNFPQTSSAEEQELQLMGIS